ncbi:MAG: hypothetical protein ACOC2V_00180 [Alkalispirochaeta sp.]
MHRYSLVLFVLLVLFSSPAVMYAESGDSGGTDPVLVDPEEPVPYHPDEFPPWAHDVRRGEIIAIGAFPIAMIVTGLTYEVGRFGYYSLREGSVSGEYAPWFFSTSPEETFTNEERIGLITSSAIISVGVAVVDYVLGRREEQRERIRRGATERASAASPGDD